MRRSGLLILIALLPLLSALPAYSAAFYPPPHVPSNLNLITVHTTTINVTGPASQSFNLDIQKQDDLSIITKLIFNTNTPLTDFSIQIVQLNYIPTNVDVTLYYRRAILPNGRALMYFFFNIDYAIQSQITQAEFFVKVPALELQLFSVAPPQVTVQKYTYSWSQQTSFLNGTIIQDYSIQYYVYRVFSSSSLTLFAVTENQAKGFNPTTLLSIIIVATVSTLLASRRSHSKKRDLSGERQSLKG